MTSFEQTVVLLARATAFTVVCQACEELDSCGEHVGHTAQGLLRLERDLGPEDGPTVEVVPFADVPKHLPHFSPISDEEYAVRITARQRAVARRMIS